jgi:hypothetical protein
MVRHRGKLAAAQIVGKEAWNRSGTKRMLEFDNRFLSHYQ